MMRYPVALWTALGGLLSTGVALLALFWPEPLTPEAQAGIIAFGNAVLLTIAAVLGTAVSTPVGSPTLPAGTSVRVTTAAGEPDRTVEL